MTTVAPRVRHSDVRQLLDGCPGAYRLKTLGAPQAPATYLILGEVTHKVIEQTVLEDLNQDTALSMVTQIMEQEIASLPASGYLTTVAKTPDKLVNLGRKVIGKWFDLVYPDSPNRLSILQGHSWPPVVEAVYQRNQGTVAPAWCTVDALFDSSLILDWKTSARPQASFRQLDYYRYVTGLPRARAAYVNLLSGQVQEAPEYVGDLSIRATINSTIGVKKDVLGRKVPSWAFRKSGECKWCPYKKACPAWS